QQYKIRGGSLELVTVIECISADGKSIAPGFISQGSYIDPECAEVDPDICLATSENGWTNNLLCIQWFQKSFISQAMAHNRMGKPILLI
ncbi:hypothetical protein WOLCODRAFT_32231, partial [Wolfiporia cocos MD-104 SS10]